MDAEQQKARGTRRRNGTRQKIWLAVSGTMPILLLLLLLAKFSKKYHVTKWVAGWACSCLRAGPRKTPTSNVVTLQGVLSLKKPPFRSIESQKSTGYEVLHWEKRRDEYSPFPAANHPAERAPRLSCSATPPRVTSTNDVHTSF